MVDLDRLLTQVDQFKNELLDLHKELVKIESINTGQMPTGNESNVADLARPVSYTHLTLPTNREV